MIRLSAFADEISPDLDEQIAVLSSEHIHFLDLRGVWNTNVLDLPSGRFPSIARSTNTSTISSELLRWRTPSRRPLFASFPSILPHPSKRAAMTAVLPIQLSTATRC